VGSVEAPLIGITLGVVALLVSGEAGGEGRGAGDAAAEGGGAAEPEEPAPSPYDYREGLEPLAQDDGGASSPSPPARAGGAEEEPQPENDGCGGPQAEESMGPDEGTKYSPATAGECAPKRPNA